MNNCNICAELSGIIFTAHGTDYEAIVDSGKNIILGTKSFVVVPSIGPLNHSHIMIVTKEHLNSFGQIPYEWNNEKNALIEHISAYFFSNFKQRLIFFESGAGKLTSHSGGCISHAHIHAVVDNPLFQSRLLSEVKLVRLDSDSNMEKDLNAGYIWYLDAEKNEYLCNNPMLPSQFLRYTYAESTATAAMWNWRRHPNVAGVMTVLETYRNL